MFYLGQTMNHPQVQETSFLSHYMSNKGLRNPFHYHTKNLSNDKGMEFHLDHPYFGTNLRMKIQRSSYLELFQFLLT